MIFDNNIKNSSNKVMNIDKSQTWAKYVKCIV